MILLPTGNLEENGETDMIEVIDLCKRYKTRKTVVEASRNISLRFPDKGMIFILGKSGGGKSTLLNLIGGLDRCDSGDICVFGQSTKEYSQKQFDSYRNTYLGFIFQDYNILPELTVGENIAIALELQGKKATKEILDEILNKMDLNGYADRMPNELSGGQLQRVAIARALVKEPKVILADEPTGALDSNTGRQIFELLKELSKEKLVIIVSHDREYSEQYADRIVEISDGTVISDVMKVTDEQDCQYAMKRHDGVFYVPEGYTLTESDIREINRYRSTANEPVSIVPDDSMTRGFRFEPTTEESIPEESEKPNFVSCRLPLKRAAKIGITGMSFKKVKLAFIILLSVVAFTLFGIALVTADYNHVNSVGKSLHNKNTSFVRTNMMAYETFQDIYMDEPYENWNLSYMTEDDLQKLKRGNGSDDVFPVYRLFGVRVPIQNQVNSDGINISEISELLQMDGSELLEIDESVLNALNCTIVTGKLPDGTKNEIAISKAMYESIRNTAILNGTKIPILNDMVGQEMLSIDGTKMTVTAVIDTGFSYAEYFSEAMGYLKNIDENKIISTDTIKLMLLMEKFFSEFKGSPASMIMVGKGFCERIMNCRQIYEIDSSMALYMVSENDAFHSFDCWEFGAGTCSVADELFTVAYTESHGTNSENELYITRRMAEKILCSIITKEIAEQLELNDRIEEVTQTDFLFQYNQPEDFDEMEYADIYFNQQDYKYSEKAEYYLKKLSLTEIAAIYSGLQTLGYCPQLQIYEKGLYDNLNIGGIVDDDAIPFNVFWMTDNLMTNCFGEYQMKYNGAFCIIPNNEKELRQVLANWMTEDDNRKFYTVTKYSICFDVSEDIMNIITKIFVVLGIVLAVFSMLIFTSFIANSITHKKHQIGILRAIGSSGRDVFRIFGSEAIFLAGICAVIASLLCWLLTFMTNRLTDRYFDVMLLQFGLKPIAMIFLIAIGTACISSYLPIKINSKKKPIDSLRER